MRRVSRSRHEEAKMSVVAMKKPDEIPPHEPVATKAAIIIPPFEPAAPLPISRLQRGARWATRTVLPPAMGLILFVLLWALVSKGSDGLPGPYTTRIAAVEMFSHPFYDNGPNDQGIGRNILHSLQRVGMGFGMAALIGIPLGFMIGRFAFFIGMTAPIISLLRPVSPLAWLPIGLLVFKEAQPAAVWVIFISSIWPMIINTAVGGTKVPQDYMNDARVLNLSEWKIFTKVQFPAVLPYTLTGVRRGRGGAGRGGGAAGGRAGGGGGGGGGGD